MSQLEFFAPVARIGLAILLNGLWQGALIAFVTWLALYIFKSANAATRYVVWSLALLAVLIVPVATSLSRVSVEQARSSVSQTASGAVHTTVVRRPQYSSPVEKTPVESKAVPATTSQSGPHFSVPSLQVHLPTIIAPVLVGVWLLVTLVILIRLIVAFLYLERLKHDSLPLSIEYRDSMPRWLNALKGTRDVRICVSEAIEVPIAVGLFDSMVLLPSHLVHSLDPAEVDQISLHELGHLLRGDDWTNAIQRIASALLFFNPAVWFISRQMDVEREVACDDYVLQLTGAVRPYAFCLTKMAEITSWPHRPMPAPGVFVTRKNISIRIERLLRTGRAIGSSIAPSVAGSVVASLVAVFLVLRMMTPTIAFTAPAPPAPPTTPTMAKAAVHPPAPVKPNMLHAPSAPKKEVAVKKMVVAQATVAPSAPPVQPSVHPASAVAPMPPMPHAHHISAMPHLSKSAVAAWPMVPTAPVNVSSIVNNAVAKANAVVAHAPSEDGTCTGCNFANANLSGRDFSNRSMEGTNFSGANLQGAHFDHAQMTGANFSDADLRNASFRDADLDGCNMRGARLDGANFDGASLTGCNIDVSKLAPEQARIILTKCEGCNFAHINLYGMDLHGVHLTGVNLSGADLRNANLSNASLEGANLAGAKLSGANLRGADMTGCNFNGTDLRGVDLSHTALTGSNMAGAIWKD